MSVLTGGLRRRREPLWLQIGVLFGVFGLFAFAVLCSGLMGLGMFAAGPGEFLLATVLAALFTIPYGLLLIWLDRNEKEPPWLLLTSFLWGALVATSLSGIANSVFEGAASVVMHPMLASQMTASISAPLVEESTKGAAVLVLVLLFRREFDNVLDGVLYGAIVGLGFAWFENISYYVMVGAEGGPVEMVKLAYIRGFLNGVGSHAAYTGLTGLGFGLWRVMRRGALRWTLPPIFLLVAMFAHFAWNTFAAIPAIALSGSEAVEYLVAYPVAVAILQAPFLLLLGVVVLLAWRHEDRMIAAYLEGEAEDVVAPAVRGRLVPARRRLFAGLGRLFTGGPLAWWRGRRLEQHLIQLAFAKWHHARDGHDWTVDQDAEIVDLRARARALAARL